MVVPTAYSTAVFIVIEKSGHDTHQAAETHMRTINC
jgi:hypothetical protein